MAEAPPIQRNASEAEPGAPARRLQQPERSGSGGSGSESPHQVSSANREASPPAERPVERKSYALARRTRSRPADLGSKQPSVEDPSGGRASSPAGVAGEKGWAGSSPEVATTVAGGGAGGGSGVPSELDRDVARLSLGGGGGQSWSQSPASYFRSEMRGGSHSPLPFPAMQVSDRMSDI